MSGLDKILERITSEAKEQAEGILAAARTEAGKLEAAGKEETDRMAAAIAKQSELDVAAAVQRIESTAQLREKRTVLKAKQETIEAVFEDTLRYLEELPDKDYFALICKMMDRYAGTEKGQILLNGRDLKRLPADFADCAAQHQLTVCREPADIVGGFILTYGDIEENCSFDVLIRESREELQDKIGQLLFG